MRLQSLKPKEKLKVKTDEELVELYIEFYSQDHNGEFKKYWEHRETPSEEIWDLILSNPNRAAKIIDKIAKAASGNWYIQSQLNSGLIWSFKHHVGERYLERLKKIKND